MSMWVVLENGASTDRLFAGREGEFGNGQSIPRHLEQLDEAARTLGLPPLNEFVIDLATVDDSVEPPWFRPADGLNSVRGLIRYLEGADHRDRRRLADESLYGRMFGSALAPDQHELLGVLAAQAAAADLRAFEVELAFAEEQRTRFHFVLSY